MPNFTGMNFLTPRMTNSEMLAIAEIDNAANSSNRYGIIDSSKNESFILYNLATNTSASDISINKFVTLSDISFQNTLSVAYPDPNDLPHHIVINNNEEYISTEKFAMDLTYSTGGNVSGFTDKFVLVGPGGLQIPSNITLTNGSVSYYDSNIKIDLSLNDEIQTTTDNKWKTYFDRNYNNMNYFAAINSHLNEISGNYPFTVSEATVANANSLLTEDGKYFTTPNSTTGNRSVAPFSNTTQILGNNGLIGLLNNYYNYTGSEFGMYKINQSNDVSNQLTFQLLKSNGISTSLQDGSGLPIGLYSGANIIKTAIDMSSVTACVNLLDPSNGAKIVQGFTANLTVGLNQLGGYTCASNNYFSIDDTKLTTSGTPYNINYLNNDKAYGRHSIDISNGYVRFANDASLNLSYISLSSDAESLITTFASTSGYIDLSTNKIISLGSRGANKTSLGLGRGFTTTERAAFIGKLDVSGIANGDSNSTFTDSVGIFYNSSEYSPIDLPAGKLSSAIRLTPSTVISNQVATSNHVEYNVSVLIESTEHQDVSAKYLKINDSRNISANIVNNNIINDVSNSVMVMATPYPPVQFDLSATFQFQQNNAQFSLRQPNKMNILNIKNSDNILTGGIIIDSSTNTAILSNCGASFTNYKLSDMNYSNFRINLTTKTIKDISDSLQPTNGWTFTTTNLRTTSNGYSADASGTLIGRPDRASELIHDKSKFLASNTTAIPINYTFRIDGAIGNSPAIYNDLNVVKYVFDASLTDPTLPFGQQSVLYKFGGSTDTIIPDLSSSDVKLTTLALSTITSPITVYQTNINNGSYIVEKWLRQKFYHVQINPSLPYYDNLLLQTPMINEEQIYYRIWITSDGITKGIEVTGSTTLGQFLFNGHALNVVQARLVTQLVQGQESGNNIPNVTSDVILHSADVCIFKASLSGNDLSSNIWRGIGYSDQSNNNQITTNVDPFSRQFSTLILPTTTATLDITSSQSIQSKSYFIDIANSLGANSTYTATCYSFDIAALSNLGSDFNPYISDFTTVQIQATPVTYNCSIDISGSKYILNISHSENNVLFQDVKVTLSNNYVLNLNIINAPNNLLRVIRKLGRSITDITETTTSYLYETNQTSVFSAKIDAGVYFTHASNVTSGQSEKFYIKPDLARIAFVNDSTYTFNHPYWCDVSGSLKPIQFSALNPNFLTLTNNRDVNQTKSITLTRVRGYNIPEATGARMTFTRNPASYTFTLDCSSSAPFLPIYHYVADICTNYIVSGPTYWIDVSLNNKAAYDASGFNFIKDASFSFYTDVSGLNPSLNYYTGGIRRNSIQRNSTYILDASNSFSNFYKGYTITTTGVVVPDSVSPNGFYDISLSILDPSFNDTAEQMIYKVTLNTGCGSITLGNGSNAVDNTNPNLLKSIIRVGTAGTTGIWKNNTFVDGYSIIDLGLIVNIKQSVFADASYILTYPIQANPADYTFSFANPAGQASILNNTGSGYISEGILSKFFKFRSRAIKINTPCNIRLNYTNATARVFYSPIFTGDPTAVGNNITWTELATSPFYPDELIQPTGVSLHPTSRLNTNWPISIKSTGQNITTNSTSYAICAPPMYRIQYNGYSMPIPSLPFNISNVITSYSTQRIDRYIDVSNSYPSFDLQRFLTNNSVSTVGASTIVSSNVPITLINLKYNAVSTVSNFNIKSNNITLNLYQGLSQPVVNTTLWYYDGSLNRIDPSNGTASNSDFDVSYSVYVTTNTGPLLTTTPLYTGAISGLLSSSQLSVNKPVGSVGYDISFAQLSTGLQGIDSTRKNINITIDNAFLPPLTTFLPLQTGNKTSITFYSSIITYTDGLYNVLLNKYTNNASNGTPVSYDFNQLFTQNPTIRDIGFKFNKIEQFKLAIDESGDVSFNYNVPLLLQTINPVDLSNIIWNDITSRVLNQNSNSTPQTLGINYTAYDQAGVNALQTVFTYSPSNNLFHKAIYVERDDIMRLSNFFGLPVFRITNSGNVITNKVSTSLLSIFNNTIASITPANISLLSNTTNNGFVVGATTSANVAGMPFRGTVDFSGNAAPRVF